MQVIQEKYIKERLDHQIDWYSSKSTFNQKRQSRLQIITIIAAAVIPFLSGHVSDDTPYIKILIGAMGVMVASITAISSLNKYQENWITYRNTSELLIHEKYLYLTMTDPYLQVALNWKKMQKPNAAWAHHYDDNFEEAMDFLNKSKELWLKVEEEKKAKLIAEQKKKEEKQKRKTKRARGIAATVG